MTKIEQTVRGFMGAGQWGAIRAGAAGEEAAFFAGKVAEMAAVIAAMPKTYETDGQGAAAVAGMHYFVGGCDWYIVELDASAGDGNGHAQAFGLANLGYGTELGYISIPEILRAGAELDLHWTPRTVGELRTREAA